MNLTDDEREKLIESVKDRYEDRIKAILTECATLCTKDGMIAGDVYDMHDEEFRWYLTVWRSEEDRKPYKKMGPNEFDIDPDTDLPNYDKSIDISFEISESATYDGEMHDGIAFGINIVENGGRILGGLQPFNYTDECWVHASDESAVEERFKLMEDADYESIPALVKD